MTTANRAAAQRLRAKARKAALEAAPAPSPAELQAIALSALVAQWRISAGPALMRRVHGLVEANARHRDIKELTQCANALLGQPARRKLVQLSRATELDESDSHRFGNQVLYGTLLFRGVRQSRFGSLQFERTSVLYDWRVENYQLFAPDERALAGWYERALAAVASGRLLDAIVALEARWGRARAQRDTRTVIARPVDERVIHGPQEARTHTLELRSSKWCVVAPGGEVIARAITMEGAREAAEMSVDRVRVIRAVIPC